MGRHQVLQYFVTKSIRDEIRDSINRNVLTLVLTSCPDFDMYVRYVPFLLLGKASRPCSSAAEEAGHADALEKRDEAGCGGGTDDDVFDVPANMLEAGDCVGCDPKGF